MEHTKGNWKVGEKRLMMDYLDMVETTIIENEKGNIIACAIYHNTKPEQEANARLISAAPDLLEACKEVQTTLENSLGEWVAVTKTYAPEWTHKIKDMLDELEQAIAKAEGG